MNWKIDDNWVSENRRLSA